MQHAFAHGLAVPAAVGLLLAASSASGQGRAAAEAVKPAPLKLKAFPILLSPYADQIAANDSGHVQLGGDLLGHAPDQPTQCAVGTHAVALGGHRLCLPDPPIQKPGQQRK
jgi:hypothetical protein